MRIILATFGFLILVIASKANNLHLSNLSLQDSNHVQFTVSWNNSWNLHGLKPPYNHDAAWIFLKYKPKYQDWQHLHIDKNDSGHRINVADTQFLSILPVNDEKGVFLRSEVNGSGDIQQVQITLRLAETLPKGHYQVRAFGTEMVYIPKDSFYLGDEASNFRLKEAGTGNPYLVHSEDAIETGRQTGALTADSQYRPAGNIPKTFPNGYSGGYVMKYEVSHEQYVDFLNMLTQQQQANRVQRSPTRSSRTFAFRGGPSNRNGIVISEPAQGDQPAKFACNVQKDGSFNDKDDGQWRAMNFLKWSDLAAYLDWAGLRPMTELEFEKICRGPKQPVKREFAWGTPKVTDADNIKKDGTSYEKAVDTLKPNSGLASHGYAGSGYPGPTGPLRNGFGGSDSSTRLSIGAAYYGVLEMSGNLWEICVVIDQKGLQFEGNPGDGNLNDQGFANEQNWPTKNGNGAGFRGGGWNSGILANFRDLAVSDRFYVFDSPDNRRKTAGGRGVRSVGN